MELVDDFSVLIKPESDPQQVLAWSEEHLWSESGDGRWRSPLVLQFEEPLPGRLYSMIGEAVERWPHIDVYAYGDADPSLAWLGAMPALENLSVNLALVEDWQPLAEARDLRALALDATLRTGVGLDVLARLPHLEELAIAGRTGELDPIAGVGELRSLTLYGAPHRDLRMVEGLHRLELLSSSFGRLRDFSGLPALPALRGVAIWKTSGLTEEHLAPFADLQALEALDLGAIRSLRGLAPLLGRPASTLRYLLLEGLAGLEDMEFVADLRALREIGIWGALPGGLTVGPLLDAPVLETVAIEKRLPVAEADRLVKGFRGRDLFVGGRAVKESGRGIRTGFRAGPHDMLRASTRSRQYVGPPD